MRIKALALLLVMVLLSMVPVVSCTKKSPGSYTITGVLDDYTVDPPTITIDGEEYTAAEGMVKYAEKAEKGKKYKFTIDEFGSVVRVDPVK